MIVAIDPGPEKSALVIIDPSGRLVSWQRSSNADVLLELDLFHHQDWRPTPDLVVEQVESYGMPVGREVFETVFWTGRFCEAWPGHSTRIPRRSVKLHLCHTARATDATIRQALIDRYGPSKERAIGTKKAPGPLHGIKADLWQALALAVTYRDLHGGRDGEKENGKTDGEESAQDRAEGRALVVRP